MTEADEPKPKLRLIGEDGNAYAILGRCHQAANRAGWGEEEWKEFQKRATSGNYDNLLCTVMRYFEVE